MYFCSMGISVLRPAFTWETEAAQCGRQRGGRQPDEVKVQQKLLQNVFDGDIVQRRPLREATGSRGGSPKMADAGRTRRWGTKGVFDN